MAKAISLLQPWAWLMVNGHKDVENRGRRTAYRGTILVHAGKGYDPSCYEFVASRFPALRKQMPILRNLDRGGIVGQFDIVDCVEMSESPWFFGPFGYVVTNARPIPFLPCPGSVTIPFEISDELIRHAGGI